VTQLLHKLGWRTSRITAQESLIQRESLLESLRRQSIDAVVSIKVLDEGIDIPACRTAFLMASQSSDRQGIQRRGRVLRKSEGKSSADLYDFLVLGGTKRSPAMRNLAKRELRRAWLFSADASNSETIRAKLLETADSLEIKLEDQDAQR
jgi:superfamily II DNA or RNA helicase